MCEFRRINLGFCNFRHIFTYNFVEISRKSQQNDEKQTIDRTDFGRCYDVADVVDMDFGRCFGANNDGHGGLRGRQCNRW